MRPEGGNSRARARARGWRRAHRRVDRGLARGDVIKVGRTVELECLDTRDTHWRISACWRTRRSRRCFAADTLFNAGAGNCFNGGDPEKLYDTFVTQLARLPDETRVYPGHEYLTRNSSSRSIANRPTRMRRSCSGRRTTTGRGAGDHARPGEASTRSSGCRIPRSLRGCGKRSGHREHPDARTYS